MGKPDLKMDLAVEMSSWGFRGNNGDSSDMVRLYEEKFISEFKFIFMKELLVYEG